MFLERQPLLYHAPHGGRLTTNQVLRQCEENGIPNHEKDKWVHLNKWGYWPGRERTEVSAVLGVKDEEEEKKK